MRQLLSLLLFLGFSVLASAQKITGLVTDSLGKPVPYASVFIKGTAKGTNANAEGQYFLEVEPGSYTLVCQSVNYSQEEKVVTCGTQDIVVNFQLRVQEVTLSAVVVRSGKGEDPAYEIIRNVIRKRSDYEGQLDRFECQVYSKGQLRVRSFPKRFLGSKVDFEDGDTSRQKMLYLSETVSKYSVDRPDKQDVQVLSSKVSGQSDGYGLSAPQFFNFYDNNIFIGNNLNPRGFISPIASNALNFYEYKYEGEFEEDGKTIDKIRVIPRRKYEPLFSGYLNIVDGDWRIHSLQLLLTRESQMQFIDSLQVEQLYNDFRNPRKIHDKIAIPTSDGFIIIPVNEIIYCHANSNYTEFYLSENRSLVSSYTLKEYDEILSAQNFFRAHRSFLINMDHVKMYRKGEGGAIIMSNGKEVELARNHKDEFLHLLNLK